MGTSVLLTYLDSTSASTLQSNGNSSSPHHWRCSDHDEDVMCPWALNGQKPELRGSGVSITVLYKYYINIILLMAWDLSLSVIQVRSFPSLTNKNRGELQ